MGPEQEKNNVAKAYASEAAMTADRPMTELENQFNLLAQQTELLETLESKLHKVSNRNLRDEPKEAEQSMGEHISTSNYVLQRNNRTLHRLIDELVI